MDNCIIEGHFPRDCNLPHGSSKILQLLIWLLRDSIRLCESHLENEDAAPFT